MGNIDFLRCPSCLKLESLEISDKIICGNCGSVFSEEEIVEGISAEFHERLAETYEIYTENMAKFYLLTLETTNIEKDIQK